MNSPDGARVGGIYRLDPGVLVLVTGREPITRSLSVTLLSPDIELAASTDLRLSPADTGLAYEVLAQTDVFGYAQADQIDSVRGELGRVTQAVLESLHALRNDEALGHQVAGPPITERSDPRWAFKLSELGRLQAAVERRTVSA